MDSLKPGHQMILEHLASATGKTPDAQRHLQGFIKQLCEKPSSLTIRDISIASALTDTALEALLHLCLCWSEADLTLESPTLEA
ncbi:MAG: hypothetical protein AAFV97_04050 [Bacteroidota bacterium]